MLTFKYFLIETPPPHPRYKELMSDIDNKMSRKDIADKYDMPMWQVRNYAANRIKQNPSARITEKWSKPGPQHHEYIKANYGKKSLSAMATYIETHQTYLGPYINNNAKEIGITPRIPYYVDKPIRPVKEKKFTRPKKHDPNFVKDVVTRLVKGISYRNVAKELNSTPGVVAGIYHRHKGKVDLE